MKTKKKIKKNPNFDYWHVFSEELKNEDEDKFLEDMRRSLNSCYDIDHNNFRYKE